MVKKGNILILIILIILILGNPIFGFCNDYSIDLLVNHIQVCLCSEHSSIQPFKHKSASSENRSFDENYLASRSILKTDEKNLLSSLVEALQGTTHVDIEVFEGEREVELFMDIAISAQISAYDLEEIKVILASNWQTEKNKRSEIYELRNPIILPDGTVIETIQIKGTVFDENKPIEKHDGDGKVTKYIDYDELGNKIIRDAIVGPQGGMKLTGAINEYNMTRELGENVSLKERLLFKHSVGWGIFPNSVYKDNIKMGFVLLGMTSSTKARNSYDSTIYKNMFETARALRLLHQEGYIVPYLHPGNITIKRNHVTTIHDLEEVRRIDPLENIQCLGYLAEDIYYVFHKLDEAYCSGVDDYFAANAIVELFKYFYMGYFTDATFESIGEFTPNEEPIEHFLAFLSKAYKYENISEVLENHHCSEMVTRLMAIVRTARENRGVREDGQDTMEVPADAIEVLHRLNLLEPGMESLISV